jgi:hypothetical protein
VFQIVNVEAAIAGVVLEDGVKFQNLLGKNIRIFLHHTFIKHKMENECLTMPEHNPS